MPNTGGLSDTIREGGHEPLRVRDLLTSVRGTSLEDLTVYAGHDGLDRVIEQVSLQKTGLALAGLPEYLEDGRVLLFGRSEIRYLEGLDPVERRPRIEEVLRPGLPCIVVTAGLPLDPILLEIADVRAVPVLRTEMLTSAALVALTNLLDVCLAPSTTLHGVVVDVLGLGVLLLGESGIGKSECALDLVVRGHRLVADDAVAVQRRAGTTLMGSSPPLTRHHMEVRGLGIMNLQDLFGVASTRHSIALELIVRLVRWDSQVAYDRLGLDQEHESLLGVPLPIVTLPVAPGRNIGILVEVAARRHLLRARGSSAAATLVAKLDAQLLDGAS
jgi:HPr kinase/phosphorylase